MYILCTCAIDVHFWRLGPQELRLASGGARARGGGRARASPRSEAEGPGPQPRPTIVHPATDPQKRSLLRGLEWWSSRGLSLKPGFGVGLGRSHGYREFTATFTAVDEATTVKYAVNTRRAVNTYCEVFAF